MTNLAHEFAFDAETYLVWEVQQTEKHEFIAGEVFATVGARGTQVAVADNLYAPFPFHALSIGATNSPPAIRFPHCGSGHRRTPRGVLPAHSGQRLAGSRTFSAPNTSSPWWVFPPRSRTFSRTSKRMPWRKTCLTLNHDTPPRPGREQQMSSSAGRRAQRCFTGRYCVPLFFSASTTIPKVG